MSFIIVMVFNLSMRSLTIHSTTALIIKCNRNGKYFIASLQINDIETNDVRSNFHYMDRSVTSNIFMWSSYYRERERQWIKIL